MVKMKIFSLCIQLIYEINIKKGRPARTCPLLRWNNQRSESEAAILMLMLCESIRQLIKVYFCKVVKSKGDLTRNSYFAICSLISIQHETINYLFSKATKFEKRA